MGNISSRLLWVLAGIALLAMLLSPALAQAGEHLLLTEVLYDAPQAGTDSAYEWVEILNPTSVAVDLGGWQLRDNSAVDVLPAFVLSPGEYVIVAANATGFATNHPDFTGNLITLEATIGNGLSNSGDRVILLDAAGNEVDAMSYGSNETIFAPPCPDVPAGQSLARVPPARDTDTATDWEAQATPDPGGPALAPESTPTARVVSPTPTSSETVTPDLPTVTPVATNTSSPTPTVTQTATASPRPTDLGLPTATASSTFTQPPSPSPSSTPTPRPSPTATATPSPSPTRTPSAARPGDVVITEIMQNPDAVSDADGEWFELYNASPSAIDLNGWTIRDDGIDAHRIDAGGPLWLPQAGYLVLGRDADPAANGGVRVAYQYSGFSLGNSADEIVLLDAAAAEIDRVAYDGGPDFPDPKGASMALISPDLDNAVGANWRAASEPWPGSAGDLGSPGAANPAAPVGQIEGHVFEDLNGDGWRQAGEPGITGVLMTLSDGQRLRTFENGWYGFYNLASGVYTVTETQPAGYASTSPDLITVVLGPGEISWGHDFGEIRVTATPSPTPDNLTATPSTSVRPLILLSEVLYDAPETGSDTSYEWIELYNAAADAVDLAGWTLHDNVEADPFPAFVLDPGAYLVVAADRAAFLEDHPDFASDLVGLDGSIGNGLSNSGDVLRLIGPDGTAVDAMSYGTNPDGFDPPCPDVAAGGSLARIPAWRDTDSADDWHPQSVPNPGTAGAISTPTPTTSATATPTFSLLPRTETPTSTLTTLPPLTPTPTLVLIPTPTPAVSPGPLPRIRLNELLPRPSAFDWNGDGLADADDEWVELVNLEPQAVDLEGWALDDVPDGGSTPYVFPRGTMLGPGAYLVCFRSQTGLALNNDADTVRLMGPYEIEIDGFAYVNPPRDGSYSRAVDGIGDWTEAYPPSPGGPNLPATPTATNTIAPTWTATPVSTLTPTATPVVYDPAAVRINELLPRPADVDWDGDGIANAYDEWIELYNLSGLAVDMAGWMLDDEADAGSQPHVFRAETNLAPGGFLLLFRSQTGIALNNDADTVRLLGPDGAVVDAFTYVDPPADGAYSRTVDGIGDWTEAYPPSPGGPNLAPTPTATPSPTPTSTPLPDAVMLNEFLPDPGFVDWDLDGVADYRDEWIELYNAGPAPAGLGGWALLDDTGVYTLPQGTMIWAGAYLLLFRGQTHLSLGDHHDRIALRRPDGVILDQFEYALGPGNDRSYCRGTDGSGDWSGDCVETPGEANRLRPTPGSGSDGESNKPSSEFPVSRTQWPIDIAAARAAAPDTRVTVAGAVTLPPGGLGRSIYIQDDTAGIRVYLRSGDFPPLAIGDQVRVTGWTRDFYGERELSVPDPGYLTWLGVGDQPVPLRIDTGRIGEAAEGQFVWVAGLVTDFASNTLTLDDGSGPAQICFPAGLTWSRPLVHKGEFWAVQGVVGQNALDQHGTGGYRIIPRCESDLGPPPAFLPITGQDWGPGSGSPTTMATARSQAVASTSVTVSSENR